MMTKKDTPFDQYSRQRIVASIINVIRKKSETFTVIDIGGYKGKTQDSLPSDHVTVVDIVDAEEANYIQTSALNLPMKSATYDLVVSFDVLEHINKNDREKFISECLRVAKRGVIICAPHHTDGNEAAEDKLNNLYKSISGEDHRWLKEHIENGLPDFVSLTKIAEKSGYYTKTIFSNEIELWMLMQAALFTNEKYPQAAAKLIALNKQYNTQLDLDVQVDEADAYRRILIAFKNENDIKKIEEFIESQKTPDQKKQKIDIIYKVTDYYLALVREMEAKYIKESEELKDKNDKLNGILSSRTWQYASKLRAIKAAVKGKNNKKVL